MKTLYLDCSMGAAGDMLMGALLELHPNPDSFIQNLNSMLKDHAEVFASADKKCGICGTHVSVRVHGEEESADHHHHHSEEAHHVHHEDDHIHEEHAHHHEHPGHPEHEHSHDDHHHDHHHTHISDIDALIASMPLPEKVRQDAQAVYRVIAQAESEVHGMPMEDVHFHEVGTMDALADVLGVCMLMHELAPEQIMASPVNVGSGTVHCAHGVLPVPAPATERILRSVPVFSGEIRSELCTPTGAALLKHFVQQFRSMPVLTIEKAGYGTGTKDFSAANVVRALLGTTEEQGETILELQCNIDDMTGEELSFAFDELLRLGALDVTFIPIQMKKNRPGIMMTCMCRESQKEQMLQCMFRNTTTNGIREYQCTRHRLSYSIRTEETPFGTLHVKQAEGYGVSRSKAEYNDLVQLAKELGLSLLELKKQL